MKTIKFILCTLLALSTLLTFSHTSSAATTFKDLSTSYRAYDEIMYLAQGEIITGDSTGRFQPNRNVTRAEAVAMIGRAIGLDGTKTATTFKDVGAGNFASGYIKAAAAKGIVLPSTGGYLKPDQKITRGEMAYLIAKAFNYSFDGSISGAAAQLKTRGIAQGVSSTSFGENNAIIRADFAVFLARAIDYTLRLTPTTTFSSDEKYINADALNIRKGPSTKYGTVGSLPRNTTVVTGYSVGSWILVKSGNTVGFVNSGYLSTSVSKGNDEDKDKEIVVDPTSPLSKLTLAIDPGHGGSDPGATYYGVKEKDVVLATGLYLKEMLEQTPFNVVYTRETDTYPTLPQRVSIAKNAKADIFVSIHANAASSSSASGTETFYYAAGDTNAVTAAAASDGKQLATYIQNRLIEELELRNRGVKSTSSLYVLKNTSMPAALAELGFLSNHEEGAKLAKAEYQKKGAKAIYHGILDYYDSKGYEVEQYYQ